jgi:ferric-chelate reductase
MTLSFALPALTRRFSPTPADIHLKAEQSAKYVKDFWLLLTCVIGLITVVRVAQVLRGALFPLKRPPTPAIDEKPAVEQPQPGRTNALAWRRLPAAIVTSAKIVSFRWTVPIGPSSVASISELAFICGYIAAMFVLLLIDSEFSSHFTHVGKIALTLFFFSGRPDNLVL